ncbi:MAG: dihydrolipoyl dehydrogenase [Candidatus Bathyarchaeia archaeon]
MDRFDVCILGAGPAGYHAAVRASQLGARVALVEEREVGGLCLNRGCIPTKVLLQSVKLLNEVRRAPEYGLKVEGVEPDFPAMRRRAERIVSRLLTGLGEVLSSYDIRLIEGRGRPISRREVEVDGRDGGGGVVGCENLVIATGSRPVRRWEVGGLIPDEEAWRLDELPGSLIILGGSPVGVELAYLFNGLGVETTIVERSPCILPRFDRQVAARLQRILRTGNIDILTGVEVLGVKGDEGGVIAFLSEGDTLRADGVVTTERVGNISGLGLPGLGVETREGFIVVNERMETSIEGVYAAGDITGGSSAQEAFLHGIVAAENIMGIDSTAERPIPRCVYTDPEAASIGMGEEEARRRGHSVRVGWFPFSASGRALSLGEGEGFVKLVVDAEYGEILGVHMIGPGATELIGGASLAMILEATPETLAEAVYPHPSLLEALKEAALSSLGISIHLQRSRRRV